MSRPAQPTADTLARFAQALDHVQRGLDWEALGKEYCESGGEHFFTPEALEGIQDTGLLFASDLGEILSPGGSSLYFGIGVAEVVPMLFEQIVLDRTVWAYTLPSLEARALQGALTGAAHAGGFEAPQLRTEPCPSVEQPCVDHLWFASVLTDPEAFPALHDRLYQRAGTAEATGRGSFRKEQDRAMRLLQTAWTWLIAPGTVTTSEEEIELMQRSLDARAHRLLIPSKARLSAIVGDSLFHCNWVA